MGFGDDILACGQAIRLGYRESGGCVIGRSLRKPSKSPMYDGLAWVNRPAARHFLLDHGGRRGYIDYARSTAERQVVYEDYRAHPGELMLPGIGEGARAGLVVIHTDVKRAFSSTNRAWPLEHWEALVNELLKNDLEVWQLDPPGTRAIPGTYLVGNEDVRRALALLGVGSLVITTEGLIHHAAAALGMPAVVLWGGRTNPKVLGYESHRNLTALEEWCGARVSCDHCKRAMRSITPDRVMAEVLEALEGRPALS